MAGTDPLAIIQKEHAAQLDKLKASLMVLDATIYCILSARGQPEFLDLFKSQIETAKRTYEEATGMDSMIGFKRESK